MTGMGRADVVGVWVWGRRGIGKGGWGEGLGGGVGGRGWGEVGLEGGRACWV